MLLIAAAAASFALQGIGMYLNAEAAREQAELQKEDIALQRESLKLQEESRLFQEEMAEAKARKDARIAQAKLLTRAAAGGAEASTIYEGMKQSIETELESGLAKEKELSGIRSQLADIQDVRLATAAAAVTAPSDLDIILGITSAGISAGTQIAALGGTKQIGEDFSKLAYRAGITESYTAGGIEYSGFRGTPTIGEGL